MRHDKPHPLAYVALVVTAAAFATPLVWMVLTSVKPAAQITAEPHRILPTEWRFDNYAEAVTAMPYALYLGNSVLLCVGSVIGTVVSSSMIAYGLARLRWPGRDKVFAIVIATMLLPWHVTMIPRFLLMREVGLYDSLGALILPTFLGDAFSIFLLRQFFLTVPEELSEAARLDGCSEWGIFLRILIPLSRPALVTVALFQFIAGWNDFGGPLLYLSDPNRFPLAYGLQQFTSAYSSQMHLLMAASVLFTLPTVVLFLIAQRAFLRGIATTGLKG